MKARLERIERRLRDAAARRPNRGRVVLWTPDGAGFALLGEGAGQFDYPRAIVMLAPDRAEAVAELNPRWLSRAEVERLDAQGYTLDVVAEPEAAPSIPPRWRGLAACLFG